MLNIYINYQHRIEDGGPFQEGGKMGEEEAYWQMQVFIHFQLLGLVKDPRLFITPSESK